MPTIDPNSGLFRQSFDINAVSIADYSISEKINILKSEKSKALNKIIQLVSFKKIPTKIIRKNPLSSINLNFDLFDASIEFLIDKETSLKSKTKSNINISLAFDAQLSAEWTAAVDLNNNLINDNLITNGDLSIIYDPFKTISSSIFNDKTRWANADGKFRMNVKIFTAKEDKFFFEISANTPYNYLEYPQTFPQTDLIYSRYFRIGRDMILSYLQNNDSTYIING